MSLKPFVLLLVLFASAQLSAADRPTATLGGKTYPVYEYGHEVKPTKVVTPIMPAAAVQAGRGGQVQVGAVVNAKGKVSKAYVVDAEAEGDIRAAVINAVEAWQFPVMRDPLNQAAISYVVMIPLSLSSSAATKPVPSPKLAEIISDPKYLRSTLGIKALVVTDPKKGEVPKSVREDIASARLAESIQLLPMPKGSVQPKVRSQVAPEYPATLRRKNVGGTVRLLYVIGADGTVKGIYCTSATNPQFALAAAVAVSQWRYTPAQIQEVAVPVIASSLLDFIP